MGGEDGVGVGGFGGLCLRRGFGGRGLEGDVSRGLVSGIGGVLGWRGGWMHRGSKGYGGVIGSHTGLEVAICLLQWLLVG